MFVFYFFINACIVVFPILFYIPDLLKTKSTIPLSVSLLISLASLFEIYFTLLDKFSLIVILKSSCLLLLHTLLLRKKPLISSLEEKIYYSNKQIFSYSKKSLKEQITYFFYFMIFSLTSLLFLPKNRFVNYFIGYLSILFNLLSLLVFIAIKKTERRDNLFKKSTYQNLSYKLMGAGHIFKFVWFIQQNISQILVLVELLMAALCFYIGFN